MGDPRTLTREQQAHAAYEAHQALLLTELRWPHLANNPAWQVLRDEAFAQFEFAFCSDWGGGRG